ncbi:hypothetical protein VTN77DRAFT_8299 [Rasamsonia byssochlamydoides]|uniref:uncharacterized protein n=1 Tax=Rasamsonia byssochlamydoides TaxID=89139 RepID=UPI003742F8BF
MDYCCACGTELSVESEDVFAYDSDDSDNAPPPRGGPYFCPWRIHCSVSDFNKIFFSNPWVWTSFIRVIIISKEEDSGEPQYQLSGVCQCQDSQIIFQVPRDRNRALIGYPHSGGRSNKTIKVHAARFHYPKKLQYPYGCLIHARCWDLIERLLGPRAENQLEVLIHVLRQRWDRSDFSLYDRGFIPWEHPEKWAEALTEETFAFRDPVKIPALRALIDEGLQRRLREPMKRRTRRWRPLFRAVERLTTSRPFPLDTEYMILDRLGCEDIPNVLRAFGWQIPDAYWFARLRKDLLFELDDLKIADTEMDWQFLCLGTEQLLTCSPEPLNRQRVLPIERNEDSVSSRGRQEQIITKWSNEPSVSLGQ